MSESAARLRELYVKFERIETLEAAAREMVAAIKAEDVERAERAARVLAEVLGDE